MSDLSSRLAALTPDQRAQLSARLAAAPPRPAVAPIAVIGIGCRFPGGANSPEEFWRRLCAGFDAVRTAPADRWDADRFYSADPAAAGKTNSRWGGFLDQVDQFDREFFGLAPREALHMDPQQRLLLETAWEALEDAGQMTDRLAGTAAGVFIGAQSHSSDYYAMQARDRERLDTYTATGTAHSILANRLSFAFDLRGPSLTVDTACSSSLVAVHLACQSLRVADCDLAIAGGVNLILTPDFHICLGKLEMMAPDGRCKTFDHRANGFVRGEGCGVVILKRLADALRDRDPVLAVVLGSAVNQDGASNGLTAPNGPAQQAVLRRALEQSQVAPEKVGYVETHGTGTALGDPIEVEALTNVLAQPGAARQRCFLGALKTNLGHLEAAAGIAGLIKAVLGLKHGAIPPNLHFERLNPHLSLAGTPFVLPADVQPWPRAAEPRIAGVSSFGFGGTNAHVVLSEQPASEEQPGTETFLTSPARLLPISARSPQALRALAAAYVNFLTTGEGAKLPPGDVAYTASLRRRHHPHRLCVVGTGAGEWAAALEKRLGKGTSRFAEGISDSPVIDNPAAKIVFAYSGQGGLWPTMGGTLLQSEPVFREAIERCDALFRPHAPWSLIAELSAPASNARLDQNDIAQPAIFAWQVALTELWRSWGIRPAAVFGQGVGEVAAAYAAGVLSLADAARVAFHYGQVMQRIAFQSLPPDASGDELARPLEGLRVMSAQAQIVSTVSGRVAEPQDFGAGYWTRNLRQPVLLAAATRTLLAAGQRLFVEIGPQRGLGAAIAQCETPDGDPLVVIAGHRNDHDPRLAMLDGLATLHAAGCDINWRQFFPDHGRCVPLPRYPWQRQRYWLPPMPGDFPKDEVAAGNEVEADKLSSKEAPATEAEPRADWFYQLDWQAHNNLGRQDSRISSLQSIDLNRIVSELEPRVPVLERECQSDQADGLRDLLDQSSADHVWAALASLGAQTSVGSHWPKTGFDRELHVLPRYERLMVRLLDILAASGVLRDDGQHWTVVGPRPESNSPSRGDRRTDRFDAARQVLHLHQRCGSRLAEVLRGQCDPLSLLFSGDEKSSAEAIYRDAAPSRVGNRMAAEALRACVAQLPADRTLRVLEIGAGTGGTTAALLPLLPAQRCEYVFTDLSRLFLQRAAENFAGFPFVRYELLDLEQPPSEQGFAAAQFDLIVAANVVHATRDLAVSLDHLRSLLASGGMLLLIECTAPRPWMDVTFGLTDGWWRFTDHHLRAVHPLMNDAAWMALLDKRGFADATALPLQRPGIALFDQSLIFARNVSTVDNHNEAQPPVIPNHRRETATYLVFADAHGMADALKRQIEARGDRCRLVKPGTIFERRADDEFSVACDSREDLRRICDHVKSDCKAVVYLAGLDRDATQPADWMAACQRPLLLVQALLDCRLTPAGGLWLVTRGAQAVTSSDAAPAVQQALLCGLGRGVALESPDLGTRLIDLDPTRENAHSAADLLAEIDAPDQEDQLALRRQQRYVARLSRAAEPSEPLAPPQVAPLQLEGAHLVTGGLGGLGAQLALHLAAAGAKHLILVVKHPLPDRREWDTLPTDSSDFKRTGTVRKLEAMGAKVTVAALDLADESALAGMFASLDFTTQPLRGVWHAAMSFSSGPIGRLSADAVRTMIEVKAATAWRLHEWTRGQPLDHFVLYSSTTALWGATGLAHYAAANAFLDALARFRRAHDLPATVINWGLWQQTRELSNVERDRTARVGLRPMAAPAALAALDRVLTGRICQAVVADVDWSIFKPAYESRRARPFLQRIGNESAVTSRGAKADHDDSSGLLIERLFSAAVDERRELLAQHLLQSLTSVLGAAAGGFFDRRKGFFELGMDSLTSVQLRRRLETDLQRSLPSTLTFTYPTIDLLADYLIRELFTGETKTATPGAAAAPHVPFPHPSATPPCSRSADTLPENALPTPVAPVEDDSDATEDELFEQLAARLVQLKT